MFCIYKEKNITHITLWKFVRLLYETKSSLIINFPKDKPNSTIGCQILGLITCVQVDIHGWTQKNSNFITKEKTQASQRQQQKSSK